MKDESPALTCWADSHNVYFPWLPLGKLALSLPLAVCLLPEGHDGPHQWTSAEEVLISCADQED